ncbi:MAG: hypothetical protein JO149_06440, partial [Gammaproteobacteria bacterium]|nr:hypothetical protein [Gammaproteobacteria bacterium]
LMQQNLPSFVIINKFFFGSDIFLRCYPPSVKDVEAEHLKELNEPATLNANTTYINNFFKWLSLKDNELSKKIALSKSSAAFYDSKNNAVVGLRIYLMNPYFSESNALEVCLLLNSLKTKFDTEENLRLCPH